MKKNIYLTILFLQLFVRLSAEYEHHFIHYAIEEKGKTKKVFFTLENGWIFVSTIDPLDEFKIYNLENLLHTGIRVEANIPETGYRLIFENPTRKGYDKINFLVHPLKEVIEALPIVTGLSEQTHLFDLFNFRSVPIIMLSDGSMWRVSCENDWPKVRCYWEEGDRIFVSQEYNGNKNHYLLVNADIFGKQKVIHYKDHLNCFYSFQNPKNVRVQRVEN